MHRYLFILAGFLLCLSAPSRAQVAVPELNPAAAQMFNSQFSIPMDLNYTTANPALIQWGAPMRAGGGWFEGKSHDDVLMDSKKMSGQYGGGRISRERFSGAGEMGWLNLDYNLAPALVTIRHTSGNLAFAALPNLAVGLGVNSDYKLLDTSTNDIEDKISSRGLGFSWRIGEQLFLGLAYGKDYLKRVVTATPEVKGSRNFLMAGVGVRGGGNILWRIEASRTTRKDFLGTTGNTIAPGSNLDQGSIEFGFSNLLFGYTLYSAQENLNGPKLKGSMADFALAPMRGVGISGRFEKNQVDTATMAKAKSEQIKSVNVTVLY